MSSPAIKTALVLLTVAAAALHCVTRPVDEPGLAETKQTLAHFPQSIEKDVDILFVVDNSESMAEEQVNLAKNFPLLIEALRSDKLGPDGSGKPCNETVRTGCRIPNVHIGVISTDLGAGNYSAVPSCEISGGDKGRLQVTPRIAGCIPPAKPYISYVEGETNIPETPGDAIEAVKEAFSCIAKLGVGGCGFEQQLEATRRALDPKLATNAGFVRKDALLAIVLITDEDDCSAKNGQLFDPTQSALSDPLGPLTSFRCFEFGVTCDVNDRQAVGRRHGCVPSQDYLHDLKDRYADFFKRLKPPGRVLIAAIAGPTDRVEVGRDGNNPSLRQSCESSQGIAKPAIRIEALVDLFGPDGQFTSICKADFGPALQALGKKILGRIGAQCIAAPILTKRGGPVCQKGDEIGPGSVCERSCLQRASCEITEVIAQGSDSEQTRTVERCPTSMWYPNDWHEDRDCGDACPCWRIVRKDSNDCDPAVATPYALDILREGEAPKGTVAEARCYTSPHRWGSDALAAMEQCQ